MRFTTMGLCLMTFAPLAAGCRPAAPPATAGLIAAPIPAAATRPNATRIDLAFRPLAVNRTVFYAMLGHSNGKIYVGTCYGVARLVEFDPSSGRSRVVATMSSNALEGGGPKLADPTLLGDGADGQYPADRWQFAQDKIHAQLFEGPDGRVYGATHVKVEDIDQTRKYPGGHWFAYDPATGKTEDLGWAKRNEGIITCCLDDARNTLYGVTWPTGYLVRCRIAEKEHFKRLTVIDLASSRVDCSTRYLGVVKDGRVYMPDGATGDIRVYTPADGRVHNIRGLTTPGDFPADPPDAYDLRGTGKWRNWWMTGTRSPDGMHLFFTGQRGGHLVEIDATVGKWGAVIDHGRAVPWSESNWGGPDCGGLVFGRDGLLYHAVEDRLLTYDPRSGRVADRGRTFADGKPVELCGGGALGADGKLYFAARREGTWGLCAIDPAKLDAAKATLLRVSPRRICLPTPEATAPAAR